MKTKTIATLTLAAISAAGVNAQELTGQAVVGVETEYVFRGVELAKESIQASLEGAYGNGYFGIWTNEPFDDEFDSEIDFYAGYGYQINDTLSADFGATVYYYPDAGTGEVDDTFEAFAGINFEGLASPAFYAYYDFDLEALTLESSFSHSIAVDEKSSVDFGLTAGWVDTDLDGEYWYYNASADYVYNFTEAMFASIGIRAGGNDDQLGPNGRESNLWGGASFSASF